MHGPPSDQIDAPGTAALDGRGFGEPRDAKSAGSPTPDKPVKDARRVMVVDDNHDSADTMAELMRLWGHEVRTANDGPSALECARGFHPQVVLLDVGLPGMDGYELARLLRAEGLAGRLLVSVTGYGQDEDRRRAEEAGFDHHLTKPVDPDTLMRLVGRG
jgi:CheY-like chemotaxis protein